jgi:EAL domain-containing protein (putative c-di-GMP-specific phosphodiesterase class I)
VIRDLEWLCRRAALDGARGLAEGHFLSLNLNPEALHATDADAESLAEQLEDAGREPSTVVVEVVRPGWLSEVQRLMTGLAPYRALGIRVAVAVGPTDEQAVSRCTPPPDFVKLTRPTVSAISLPTVIGFAQRAAALAEAGGPIPIAEGIESEAIAHGVAATGILLGQGYHLGRPAAMDREGHLRAEPVPEAGVGGTG